MAEMKSNYLDIYGMRDKLDTITEGSSEALAFLKMCYVYEDDTNSQNFQDIWAIFEEAPRNKGQKPWFIDIGAADPIISNNTYLLEKLGWHGILVEPNPVWHRPLDSKRSFSTKIIHKAVSNKSDETVRFRSVSVDPMLSTIEGFGKDDEHAMARQVYDEIEVKTISLADLLVKYSRQNIDYISLDTEGSELSILKAFFDDPISKDFNIHTWSIEHNYTIDRDRIYWLMRNNGYQRKFEFVSRWDDFYIKEKK